MERVFEIQNKYKQSSSDNIIPYKYISEAIAEYSSDLKTIEDIYSKEKD